MTLVFAITHLYKKKIVIVFVFDACVCFVLCKFVSGLILWFMDNLWFDDFHAE